MQPTSLVTGGAGFIGAHVVNELLKQGHKVIVLDDLSGGFIENINPKAEFIKGSVTDHVLISEIFSENRFDYVYHLAAYAAEGLSHFIKRFNYTNNVVGSINLINESVKHKVKCFVFTSSIAVYGNQKSPVTENNTPLPEDPYGIAKYAIEMDLKVTHEMFGLNYIIFRPHNVYGEYQNIGDKYRNVVGIFMNQLMQGIPLTVFGDGNQTRAFSYIADVAVPIANSVNINAAYNQIINIGADSSYTVNELAREVMKSMNITGNIRHLEARNEVINIYADHTKADKLFGNQKKTSLPEGLKKMAAWAVKSGSRKSQKFSNIEIVEKLPPVWLE
ncbi:MAG: NAD-dependent epimerase/dehydratase family protein [Bacteroidetes bacterium]|nr:NAD-dependent epimerase/dehydratase family protein [Bacteroidota bacterium]